MYLYYILLIKLSIRDEIVNRPLPHINFTSDKTKTYGNHFSNGIPIFLSGIIAKGEKKSFRQNTKDNKHTLVTDFKTNIDNYTQFFGPALATGLKLAHVEGRSDWGRYLASSAM
jgi:hypothetical protein